VSRIISQRGKGPVRGGWKSREQGMKDSSERLHLWERSAKRQTLKILIVCSPWGLIYQPVEKMINWDHGI